MVEYEIQTEKFKFGDNRVEEALEKLGLERKGIKVGECGTLIYEAERQKKLTHYEIAQIPGVILIKESGKVEKIIAKRI